MKDSKQPPSKEKIIALGFTVAVHVVAITGLLFLGLSKVPEPPKPIKTILIKPEDIPLPEPKPVEATDAPETAQENVAAPQPSGPSPAELQAVAAAKALPLKHQAEQNAHAQAAAEARRQAEAAEKADEAA